MTKKRMVTVLGALVKNRSFKCKEEWLELPEYKVYEELRKQNLVTRTKLRNTDGTWYIYKCTTNAEKLFQKINK